MGMGTKLIAHEGMGSGMGIFLKRGYGDGHYGTLPNGYPLPSLNVMVMKERDKELALFLEMRRREKENEKNDLLLHAPR